MKLTITSASGNVLDTDNFSRITLMTEMGEIGVLPGHEPLLSAIRPGIMSIEYIDKDKKSVMIDYASGGGVINISPESVTIVADVIENGDHLTDLAYIERQKKEAEELMKSYREENGDKIDPKRLIDLEYELLKYTAMHRLGQKYHIENTTGSRR
jgi:F-type H+-transporting ATPase subunit epsilon